MTAHDRDASNGGGDNKRPSPPHAAGVGRDLAAIAVVSMILCAVYWPVLSATAVHCDDDQYFRKNPLVANPGWDSARRFFGEVFEPSSVRGYYHPLSMISLMSDAACGGSAEDLRPFHRTNLLLHVGCAALTYLIVVELFRRPMIAVAVALLWGLHPLTVEPVAWVSERKTLLAAFFSFAAVASHLRYVCTLRGRWLIGGVLLFSLALLSKPTSTPLPIALLLLDAWPLVRWGRRAIAEKIPYVALAAVSSVVTLISQGNSAGAVPATQESLAAPILKVCHNVAFYLGKLVAPTNLSGYYPVPRPLGLSNLNVLIGVVATGALVAILILTWRRSRAPGICAAAFFVLLLPTMQIIGFRNVIAGDKYAYLPMIAAAIFAAWVLCRAAPARLAGRATIVCLTVVALVTAEAWATRRNLAHWRDTEALCRHMLAQTPDAPEILNHYGLFLMESGRADEAVYRFRRAIDADPTIVEARNNLGLAYSAAGDVDAAMACWRGVLGIEPREFTALYNLGTTLAGQGHVEAGIAALTRAIEARPRAAAAHNNLAGLLAAQGRTAEALESFQRAVALEPASPSMRRNLATLLFRLGQSDAAIGEYREAARLQPDSADGQYTLGDALRQAGRFDEARRAFAEALRLNPADAEAAEQLRALESASSAP
jgi:tetratricopeptide (TPR) repeat protein